jgi:ankyrin repeat protein
MQNRFLTSALAAAKQGPEAFAAEFKKNGANANVLLYDDCGDPLIHCVIKDKDIPDANLPAILVILVQHQVNLSSRDTLNKMPLATAAAYQKKNAVNFLIEHKAEINDAKDPALCKVMYMGKNETLRLDIVKTLVQHGANINIQDKCGYSPLMGAIINSRLEIIEYLLSQGADLFLKLVDGPHVETALALAYSQYVSASKYFKENHQFTIHLKNCLNLLIEAAIISIYRQVATFTGSKNELEECLNKHISDLAENYRSKLYSEESNSTNLKKLLIQQVLAPVLARIKAEREQLHAFQMGSRDPHSHMYRFFKQTNGRDLVPMIFSYVHEVTPHMVKDNKESDKTSSSSSSICLSK